MIDFNLDYTDKGRRENYFKTALSLCRSVTNDRKSMKTMKTFGMSCLRKKVINYDAIHERLF